MELKNNPMAVLAIVALIGVASLVIMFKMGPTAQVAVKIGGQSLYGSAGMAYATDETMSCETLIEYGRVPAGFDYEAAPSDAVNRFGLDKCYDARELMGYFCCSTVDLY
ncbi:hypothetical protein KY304_00670 [Candidatus Woesearchaeota archaeon]|nr:hypothetical protein [Candidatus Woesearchaeota archaeon]